MGWFMNAHYQILELDSNASLEEVKKAYRRLAKIYHPDKNHNDPTATDKFTAITNAYDEIVKVKTEFNQEVSKSFALTADMSANYFGTIAEVDGERFKVPAGIISGDKVEFTSPTSGIVEFNIVLRDQEGFTVEGRDLHTSMEVYERDIRKGEVFNLSNHPYPLGKKIVFPKDIQHGCIAIFPKCGLTAIDEDDKGDLFVEVLFKPTVSFKQNIVKKASDLFQGTRFFALILKKLFKHYSFLIAYGFLLSIGILKFLDILFD